jgi:hypothetical protein
MAIKLSTTKQEAKSNGVKILVYGEAGVGKTVLCATTGDHSKVIILSAESGLLSLADTDISVITINTVAELLEAYKWLSTDPQGLSYEWICIDSLSEIAELVLVNEKVKAGKDLRAAYVPMQEIVEGAIKSFRDLPRNIMMTCKLNEKEDDRNIVRLRPKLVGQNLPVNVTYLFDEVFLMKSEKNPEGEIERYLQTQPESRVTAKDRSGKLDFYERPNLQAIADKILGNTQTQTTTENKGE